MAGHSQFKNIMHRKGAQDKKRAKIFNRIMREIIVAVKESGPDASSNPKLRAAIINARGENMPKDKVDNAIKRGAGPQAGDDYFPIRYEGYGAGGVAVIVEVLTDNKNRAASEVRSIFTKGGGNLGESGSVSFMFDRVGMIVYPKEAGSEEKLLEAAIEAGAENCESGDEHTITCQPDDFGTVRDALQTALGDAKSSKLTWVPKSTTPVSGDIAASLFKMIEALEDCDDVQEVIANLEVDEATLQKLSA